MGEGKEAPPKCGGGVSDAAEPVVLRMELHSAGGAKKVRKCITHMPGVQSVVADAAANRIVVAGTADPAALKARIEAKTKMPVEIVSAGAGPNKPAPAEPKSGGEKKISKKNGGRGDKKNPDKGGGGDKGDKAGSSKPQPKDEEKEKKQPPEEKKPKEVGRYTRGNPIPTQYSPPLPCYALNYYADEVHVTVKVTGTMDDAAMVGYLTGTGAPGKKGGSGGDDKKDKGSGEKKKIKRLLATTSRRRRLRESRWWTHPWRPRRSRRARTTSRHTATSPRMATISTPAATTSRTPIPNRTRRTALTWRRLRRCSATRTPTPAPSCDLSRLAGRPRGRLTLRRPAPPRRPGEKSDVVHAEKLRCLLHSGRQPVFVSSLAALLAEGRGWRLFWPKGGLLPSGLDAKKEAAQLEGPL